MFVSINRFLQKQTIVILSIVIPYYNSNAWIGALLETLLDQDLAPNEYEIIVVDDASTEEPVVLKDYVARYSHVHYHRQEKSGVSEARNTGIAMAQGEWLYFCDSDDFVQPKVLKGILEAAEQLDLEMVFANRVVLRPNQKPDRPIRNFSSISPVVTAAAYYANPKQDSYGIWRFLLRRSILIEHQIRFPDMSFAEDRVFYLDIMPYITRVAHIDVDLYYHVLHESSTIHLQRRLKCSEYMSQIMLYILRVDKEIKHGNYETPVFDRMEASLDQSAFYLLWNVFQYCPVRETLQYLTQLEGIGAYPVKGRRQMARERFVQRWMNVRWLWVLGCRLFHLVPLSIRIKMGK